MDEEIQKWEVYAILEAANITFEYYRGAITFWANGMKHTVYPVRKIPLFDVEIPIYHKGMLEMLIAK